MSGAIFLYFGETAKREMFHIILKTKFVFSWADQWPPMFSKHCCCHRYLENHAFALTSNKQITTNPHNKKLTPNRKIYAFPKEF